MKKEVLTEVVVYQFIKPKYTNWYTYCIIHVWKTMHITLIPRLCLYDETNKKKSAVHELNQFESQQKIINYLKLG